MPEALIRPELVQLGAAPADKTAAIRQAGQLLVAAGCIAPAYVQSLLAREQTANTYLGSGVAIPHGQIADRHLIERTGIAVLQAPGGVEWNAGQRATLIFAIAAQSDEHLALLRRLTRLLQDEATLQKLACTADAGDILRALELPAAPAAAADAAAQAPAGDYAQGFDWRMPYPNGLHARPAQQWVETARRFAASVRVRNGQEAGDAKNLMALLQLGIAHGQTLHVSAQGSDAAAALAALQGVMNRLTAAEEAEAEKARQAKAQAASRSAWQPAGQPPSLQGISASPGLAIGTLRVRRAADIAVPDRPAPLAEGADALDEALAVTRAELLQLAQDTAARIGKAEGGIFRAQAELLGDTGLIAQACQRMAQGHGAAWSWHEAVQAAASQLASACCASSRQSWMCPAGRSRAAKTSSSPLPTSPRQTPPRLICARWRACALRRAALPRTPPSSPARWACPPWWPLAAPCSMCPTAKPWCWTATAHACIGGWMRPICKAPASGATRSRRAPAKSPGWPCRRPPRKTAYAWKWPPTSIAPNKCPPRWPPAPKAWA